MKKVVILLLISMAVVASAWYGRGLYLEHTNNISSASKESLAKRIIAIGDISCPPNGVVDASNCQMKAVAEKIKQSNPDNLLFLGDLQYLNGEEEYFKTLFGPLWGSELLDKAYSVPGNHEYNTAKAQGYFGFWNGAEQLSKQAGDRDKGYFSLNIGSWHVVALNSNCKDIGGCDLESTQGKWLAQDLAQNKSRCTLAMWHHPVFSSGAYRNNQDSKGRGKSFWMLLEQHRAEVILTGHEHLYERFSPQTSDGIANAGEGVRQFIVGAGGKTLTKFTGKPAVNQEVGIDSAFGYLEMKLEDSSYSWKYVDIAGRVLDSGTSVCHD